MVRKILYYIAHRLPRHCTAYYRMICTKDVTIPECDTLLRIMECEESWQKLKYSKILVQNKIINPKSAVDILNQMAAKNFQISHLLKV